MLENLHVKDLALIREAEIDFKEGFNILTGETGAGKSIVLGSINLALGAKAGADVIRSGKDSALIELSFILNEKEIKKVKMMDLPVEDDGQVILTRKISSTKSVCRMNGETITLSQLRELSGILLNMYGQHEHQSLLKSSTYSKMLDEYAGREVNDIQEKLKAHLKEYRELIREKESNDGDPDRRKRQIELLEFEINEIESASIKSGEDEELESRYKFLNNAQKIMKSIAEVHELTGNDGQISLGTMVGRAVSSLKSIQDFDDEIIGLGDELSEIENLLDDFNRSLSNYENKLTFDGEEFLEVSERLDVINHLKDKYGRTIEDIFESFAEKNTELDKLKNYEEYLSNIDSKLSKLKTKMLSECKEISKLRKDASGPLVSKLTEAMKSLNFNDVRLQIDITENEDKITENGFDDVEFLISLNTGEDIRPMQNVASGGELSRMMLAIKSVFADRDDVSTLIFDEIDTGISGVTAFKVAEMMNNLSDNHQIICITHLPQIAAMADEHFLIEKTVYDGRTETNIVALEEDNSIRELARMLGTDKVTEGAINNARELKERKKK